MRRRAGLALVLAGCSGEPPAAPVPTPTPLPTATPVPRALAPGQLPSPELDGATPVAGRWRFAGSAGGYAADGRTRFAIRCDRTARRIVLARAGAGDTLRLFTADAAATFPARPVGGMAQAEVATGLTFLDALARADAIGVASQGGAVVRLPGDAAIGRVVRACRPAGGG